MGLTLLRSVCSLVQWAGEHLSDIDAARAAYDERLATGTRAAADS